MGFRVVQRKAYTFGLKGPGKVFLGEKGLELVLKDK